MGYGWNTRSAEEVQRQNGTRFTFDTLAERYNNTKPLRGKRKELDIRPMAQRDRDWERVVKVNENEYYLTNTSYRHFDDPQYNSGHAKHCRAITITRNAHDDVLTIHTPRNLWHEHDKLNPYMFIAPSTFYFYEYNLPNGLRMFKHKAQNYVGHLNDDGKWLYYTVEKGDIQFIQKHGETKWLPLCVRRETIHKLDRKKTKAVREELKPFYDYCLTMMDLIEPRSYFQNIYNNFLYAESTGCHTWRDVFKLDGDEIPEHWFTMAQGLKNDITNWVWHFDKEANRHVHEKVVQKDKLMAEITRHVFRVEKPCIEIDVPLGEMCRDKYKHWFN